MNIKKIKELVDIMNDNDLAEVEVEQDGVKIKLIKNKLGVIEQVMVPSKDIVSSHPISSEESSQPASRQAGAKEIKAPMVGTFYRSPAPDAAPYVEVGDFVQKGDVVCIVEAMKLMNEVKSEVSGRVVEISVENAEAVEFGQVLFLLEPA